MDGSYLNLTLIFLITGLLFGFTIIKNLKDKEKRNIDLKKMSVLVLSALISAFGVKLLIQSSDMLTGGVSGISLIFSRLISRGWGYSTQVESVIYSGIYFTLNVPIFILGIKKLSRKFAFLSFINVVLFTLFVSILPLDLRQSLQLDQINDPLMIAVLSGLVIGFSAIIAFKSGFSHGGTDILSMYFMKKSGKNVGNYSFIFNIIVLFLGYIFFQDLPALLYTVVYFFVTSLTINTLYLRNKKVLIQVVSDKGKEVADCLIQNLHHTCTIVDSIGGYSKKEKKQVSIVVTFYEHKEVVNLIKSIDEESFITVLDVRAVYGNFYLPPID